MTKIVILDGFAVNPGDMDWAPLKSLGNLAVYDRTKPEEVVSRGKDAEILLTNKTVLDRQTLEQLPKLRFISVLATGFNVVDIASARDLGIRVSNIPAYSSHSVAQLVFAYLLNWSSQVALLDASVKKGGWCASQDFSYTLSPLHELAGKTLGIIGYGEIGRMVARTAKTFGMRVLAVPHKITCPRDENAEFLTLGEMLPQADFVTIHCPLTAETEKLICRKTLRMMKPGSRLINTARGGIVDEEALAEALRSGHLAGAAADVLSCEPPKPDNPLLHAPNMTLTPHVAWASAEARTRLIAMTAENIRAYLSGTPVHLVN